MMFYLMSMIHSIFSYIELMLCVLISVAFLTLLERKILGYIQIRKGPNKVGLIGLFQPFSDAIKLFSKEISLILKSNFIFYYFSPILSMMLMLMLWANIPIISIMMNSYFSLMMIFCLMSMGVYAIMIAGWSSNSIYSLIGGLRSVAQTISYEVSMILIILSVIYLSESFNLIYLMKFQIYSLYMYMLLLMSMIFFVSLLAELNRTPFDFAEGESELVSGFNTEYMSGGFALIFIAEYGMIMFMMYLFMILFVGGNIYSIMFYLYYMMLLFLIIWVRGTYPRFRYDNLMYLTWKSYLPVSLMMIMFIISIK